MIARDLQLLENNATLQATCKIERDMSLHGIKAEITSRSCRGYVNRRKLEKKLRSEDGHTGQQVVTAMSLSLIKHFVSSDQHYVFAGYVTNKVLDGISAGIEDVISCQPATSKKYRKIFSIYVEMLQNILFY